MLREKTSTYHRILRLLKETGQGLSAKELCRELKLSSMAVRRQLVRLEKKNLIIPHREKQKIGRPVSRYHLTDNGHEFFFRDYAQFAVDLLVSVNELEGPEKINRILEHRRKSQVDKYRDRVRGKTLEERVREVVQVLAENGYMAQWEKLDQNRFLIKEMNCAVAQVTKKFPQVCLHEQGFLAELLQAKVTRRQHMLDQGHFCSYIVEGI